MKRRHEPGARGCSGVGAHVGADAGVRSGNTRSERTGLSRVHGSRDAQWLPVQPLGCDCLC